MKIWLVSSEYPTSADPLRGIFVFDQAKNLQAAGHEIVVMVIDLRSILRKRKLGRFSYVYQNIQYEIISIPVGNVPYRIFDALGALAFNNLYQELVKNHGAPDLVHAHFYEMASIVAKSKIKNTPFVITEHSSVIHNMDNNFKLWKRMNYAYKKANKVIAVSEALANVIRDKFDLDVEIIPNIVDLSIFNLKNSQKLNSPKENLRGGDVQAKKITFISTGNLVKIKNMDVLIRAFAKAFPRNESIQLLICGEGPEREYLTNLVQKLDQSSKIKLLGQKSREELASLYESANVFVLASQSETFGLAFVEALSRGLPVVATKCGGPEGFVDISNGILVEVGDVEDLTKALKKMSRIWSDFNSEKISAKICQMFSKDSIIEQLENLYFDCLDS